MTKATALYDDIPAPPPLGLDDAVDEMLVGLDAPPRARRRVLAALLGGIAVVALALAGQFKDDAVYALRGGPARSLGDGRVVSSAELAAHGNGYVTLRATPSVAGAVTYSRWLFPGEHLVFPVAGREGEAVYVQVSQDGAAAMARGEFQGRLIPFDGAGGRYAPVARYLRGQLRAPVAGSTWLLVDGATPQALRWAPLVASLLLALAVSDLALLVRLLRPSRR